MIATKILAGFILILGLGSTAISIYIFFVAVPPILATLDKTAEYLSSLTFPEIQLNDAAGNIRRAADGIQGCPGLQYGGCAVFDLRETKAELYGLADSMESVGEDVGTNASGLESRIHLTGSQLHYLRPMILAVGGWMLAVSVVLTLSGGIFLLIDKNLEKRIYILQQHASKDTLAT